MKLEKNYKKIGNFDVTEITKIVSEFPKDKWFENSSRQQLYQQHKQTQSIFINDLDNRWTGQGYPLVKYHFNDRLEQLTESIVSKLEVFFNGKVGKTVFINLPKKCEVSPHRDGGYYLAGVHRCHIPIITNDKVDFMIGSDTINMKPGICYEINNTEVHAVYNKGKQDRVHLLIDIIPVELIK